MSFLLKRFGAAGLASVSWLRAPELSRRRKSRRNPRLRRSQLPPNPHQIKPLRGSRRRKVLSGSLWSRLKTTDQGLRQGSGCQQGNLLHDS